MNDGLRAPLIVVEVGILGAILALVDDPLARTALGLLVTFLLIRGVMPESGESRPPPGMPERRQDHLFRHWTDTLVKKIREFHAVCQAVNDQRVNLAVGQMKIREIEQEIEHLLQQVTESAKPDKMRKRRFRTGPKGPEGSVDRRREEYGGPLPED